MTDYPYVMQERLLKYCLLASIVIHATLIARFPYKKFSERLRPIKDLEVTYQKAVAPPAERPLFQASSDNQDALVRRSPSPTEVLIEKKAMDSLLRDISKIFQDQGDIENQPVKVRKLSLERKISLIPVTDEMKKNPVYQSYNSLVRGKIKAHVYANHRGTDMGEVYVRFLIDSHGNLKQVSIFEERTSANPYLREICSKSVTQAGPFPPFSSDLQQYAELPFNVRIIFGKEVEVDGP